MMFKS